MTIRDRLAVLALLLPALALALPAQCPGNYGGYGGPVVGGPSFGGRGGAAGTAPDPGYVPAPGPAAPGVPGGAGNGDGERPGGPTTGGPAPRGGPAGPATGGGRPGGSPGGPAGRSGGTGGAAAGRTGARGAALSFARGVTSQERLQFDWQHPVPKPRDGDRTAPAGPLPLAEALRELAEGDERPLLVLRECSSCAGSDQALLSRSTANDKTFLLASWFRVVRLPSHVLDPSHPFHNVFAGYPFGDRLPHFFLLARPEGKPVTFTGLQTQSSLWKGMVAVLEQRYARDPEKAVREWLLLLDQFDRLDAEAERLQTAIDEARAKDGPGGERVAALQSRLAETRRQRDEALAREQRVRDLHLLATPASPAPQGPGGG